METLQQAALAHARSVWTDSGVWEPNDVPPSPTTPYLLVSVDGGRDEVFRSSGDAGSDGHRLVVMAVGRVMDELGFAVDKARAAFRGYSLEVAGLDCTPCVTESSGSVVDDPDAGGLLSLTLIYTFNAYPTE